MSCNFRANRSGHNKRETHVPLREALATNSPESSISLCTYTNALEARAGRQFMFLKSCGGKLFLLIEWSLLKFHADQHLNHRKSVVRYLSSIHAPWLQLAIDDLWCCEIDKTCLWISDLSKRDTESYETFLYNQNIWLSWFCNLQLNYKKSYPINRRFKRRMVSLEFWNFPKIIQTLSYAIGKLIIVNYSNRVRILIP